MAKAFSIASWNVEHFKQDPTRVDRVIDFVAAQNPDMLALYEVESKEVFASVTAKFPGYTFQITEGEESQEILVGVRASLSAFFTQKLEFKSGTTSMRPGLLATVTVASKSYCVLFLHLASSNEPRASVCATIWPYARSSFARLSTPQRAAKPTIYFSAT
jgi:exonuclease III